MWLTLDQASAVVAGFYSTSALGDRIKALGELEETFPSGCSPEKLGRWLSDRRPAY